MPLGLRLMMCLARLGCAKVESSLFAMGVKRSKLYVCDGPRSSNWQGDRLDEDTNKEGEALKRGTVARGSCTKGLGSLR
jgi:hypothetical protein